MLSLVCIGPMVPEPSPEVITAGDKPRPCRGMDDAAHYVVVTCGVG